MPRKKKTRSEMVKDRFFAIVELRRKEQHMTLEKLADMCGTTRQTITHLANGRSPMRIDIMCNISVALQFDKDDIDFICSPMEYKPLNINLGR